MANGCLKEIVKIGENNEFKRETVSSLNPGPQCDCPGLLC